MPPQHVAVLGGGITGLTSAYHLARRFPATRITLIEKESRTGGWLKSDRIRVRGHDVLVEAGPRTLRPNSKALLELIHLLNLESQIISISKSDPAARNRFLHIPGTNSLTLLPTSLLGLLQSSLGSIIVKAVLRDFLLPPNGARGIVDESVDSFLSRRFGSKFALMFGSALVHGIYAADSRILSVRSAFPSMWDSHMKGGGSLTRSVFLSPFRRSQLSISSERYDLGTMPDLMKNISVFSFRNGLNQLSDALRQTLLKLPNVELLQSQVKSLSFQPNNTYFKIKTTDGELLPTHTVSAIPLPALSSILTDISLPHLDINPSASVTVVNLIFDHHPSTIHPAGFGYLIPRPFNSERNFQEGRLASAMLGTVFDSSALAGQDEDRNITKLTVMLGGPHKVDGDIDIDELVGVLSKHLSRSLPAPIAHKIQHQANCIPIPAVGHVQRIAELQTILNGAPWDGRLAVIGAGVGGVSVGDCIEAGRNVASRWS